MVMMIDTSRIRILSNHELLLEKSLKMHDLEKLIRLVSHGEYKYYF